MLATHRSALLQSLANTIADYRQNEIAPITPAHVEKWLNQFEICPVPDIINTATRRGIGSNGQHTHV